MKKPIYIFGNWKMNMSVSETVNFVQKIVPIAESSRSTVGIFPSFMLINVVNTVAKGKKLKVGAQNMSEYSSGAYTGEISTLMLKESGAQLVLIGHSERRAYFHEDNEMIHRKLKRAINEGLNPLLCIGETREEKENGKTQEVLTRQLSTALKGFSKEEIKKIFIVYEPVWAIGSGNASTPKTTKEVHLFCLNYLVKNWTKEIAETIPFLYGGSVTPENVAVIMEQSDIDGVLVGRASLDTKLFMNIIKNAEA